MDSFRLAAIRTIAVALAATTLILPLPRTSFSSPVEVAHAASPNPGASLTVTAPATVVQGEAIPYTFDFKVFRPLATGQLGSKNPITPGFTFLSYNTGCWTDARNDVVCGVNQYQPVSTQFVFQFTTTNVPCGTVFKSLPFDFHYTPASDANDVAWGMPANDTTVVCPSSSSSSSSSSSTSSSPTTTDIGVTKIGPTSALRGGTAAYTVRVTNAGSVAATNVVVTDTPPAGFILIPASSDPSCAQPPNGGTVTCALGAVDPGVKDLALTFAVPACTPGANSIQVVNGAVLAAGNDATAANNSASAATTLVCPAASSSSAPPGNPACSDGRDNDGDGLVDYPADPGCSSPQDTDEYNAPVSHPACSDGIDNDGDNLIDAADPGCHTDGNASNSASYNPQDNDESNAAPAALGCIDLVKETYDTLGHVFTPVPQFTFHLDGQITRLNDGSGRVRFENVTPGIHLVTEDVPASWTQVAITPQGGMVTVLPGSTCAAVSVKNRQVLPGTPPLSTFDPAGGSHVTLPPPTTYFEDDVRVSQGAYPVFPDVDSSTDEGQAANLLQRRGIVGGFPDGTFRPTRGVNRAEAAKFLLLASGTPVPDAQNDGYFWDVLDGEWYVRYVAEASLRGIIIGYPDGSFGPEKPVNTAEFLKMLALTFNLPLNLPQSYADVPAGAWFAPYAGVARQYGLFPHRPGTILDPSRPLTRAETALAIARILTAGNR